MKHLYRLNKAHSDYRLEYFHISQEFKMETMYPSIPLSWSIGWSSPHPLKSDSTKYVISFLLILENFHLLKHNFIMKHSD